ncbi:MULTISPECIES: Flp family type IVb pilin [unclassified Sphingomonas]|uniref:Flp family type IVb pilin n=1 Tax=unclassified Sphingomonas TaxID=196159 RepID=UPI00161AF4DF|nr:MULTISPECIES: Flp family type IVb pilin [unclassified Sphingomonas]MBB3349370.1 Flp pilus assembly pilin Flp [Sphingomonas sp. BK069]MBB3475126.1 Flp pilus assembly pilin Flp [Sphingomonas sp. BK345]
MARPRTRRPLFSRLGRDDRGATAVEYALILAAVALTIAAGLGRVSTALSDVLTTVSTNLLVGR